MTLLRRLAHRSVRELVRLSCLLALTGLAIMAYSVLSGKPLPVILAMSLGHLVGGASFACFLLAVCIDGIRRDPARQGKSSEPGMPKSL